MKQTLQLSLLMYCISLSTIANARSYQIGPFGRNIVSMSCSATQVAGLLGVIAGNCTDHSSEREYEISIGTVGPEASLGRVHFGLSCLLTPVDSQNLENSSADERFRMPFLKGGFSYILGAQAGVGKTSEGSVCGLVGGIIGMMTSVILSPTGSAGELSLFSIEDH